LVKDYLNVLEATVDLYEEIKEFIVCIKEETNKIYQNGRLKYR
jgi:hypothetical protein